MNRQYVSPKEHCCMRHMRKRNPCLVPLIWPSIILWQFSSSDSPMHEALFPTHPLTYPTIERQKLKSFSTFFSKQLKLSLILHCLFLTLIEVRNTRYSLTRMNVKMSKVPCAWSSWTHFFALSNDAYKYQIEKLN